MPRAVVFDGLPANLAAARGLGFSFDPENLEVYKEIDGQGLFVFVDYVHAFKLVRNLFARENLVDGSGGIISWEFVVLLWKHQQAAQFKYGNKLSERHVNFESQIMKVYLMTQLFSRGVADALYFLRTLGVPEFQGSEATERFIRLLNDLFDILNSRSTRSAGKGSPSFVHMTTYSISALRYR